MTTRNSSHPTSDREALSALFDGELTGDAARFALKRLDHDHEWRDTCDRWRMIGESLRGQGALLPAAFPARVRDAMRAESMAAMQSTAVRATGTDARPWRGPRWGSVALAASAAMVAFFLARQPGTTDAPAQSQVADTPTVPAPQPQAPRIELPAESPAEVAGAAVAVAAVSRPSQRQRNVQRDRAATDRMISSVVEDKRAPVTGDAGPSVVLVSQQAPADVPAEAAHGAVSVPTEAFAEMATGTQDASPARPWPRAVLPQYSGNGTLAADYASAPSFYPFSPRDTQAADAQAPAPEDGASSDAPTP